MNSVVTPSPWSPVSVMVTLNVPTASASSEASTGSGASKQVSAEPAVVQAATKKRGRPPAKKDAQSATLPAKAGKNGSTGTAASERGPKVVFAVEPNLREWLVSKLSGGPVKLSDLADELAKHVNSKDGRQLTDDRKHVAATRAIRMYGVNKRVRDITIDGEFLKLVA